MALSAVKISKVSVQAPMPHPMEQVVKSGLQPVHEAVDLPFDTPAVPLLPAVTDADDRMSVMRPFEDGSAQTGAMFGMFGMCAPTPFTSQEPLLEPPGPWYALCCMLHMRCMRTVVCCPWYVACARTMSAVYGMLSVPCCVLHANHCCCPWYAL